MWNFQEVAKFPIRLEVYEQPLLDFLHRQVFATLAELRFCPCQVDRQTGVFIVMPNLVRITVRKHQCVFRFRVEDREFDYFVKKLYKVGGIRAVFDRLTKVIDHRAEMAMLLIDHRIADTR